MQIATAADFASPAADVITAATQITLPALAENDYVWRVRAVNGGSLWSGWSQPSEFTLDATPYRRPYLESPAHGTALATPGIALRWIDDHTFTQHSVQIYSGEGSLAHSGTEDSLISSTIVSTTNATTEPLADGVYAWRVCRLDEMEAALECSALREVEIDTVPPASPVPSSYADGAQVTDRTPTFSWRPVDGASEYHIQVYRHYAAAVGDKPVEADTLGPLVSSVTTETFYAVGGLADGRYGWRVRARDAASNWSVWSESRSFTLLRPASWPIYLPALAAP